MKILLLNDTTDLQNWGAQAGIDALKQIIAERIPDSQVESLTYGWVADKMYVSPPWLGGQILSSRNRMMNRFSKEFQFLPLVADEFDFIASQWLRGMGGPQADEFLNKLKGVDLIVFNAEGSVYRNNFTAVKALFLLWLAATRFSVPGLFMNGSVHMSRVDPILPAMIGKTFSQLSGIAVREPFSLRNVDEFLPGTPVRLVPDSAFYFDEAVYLRGTSAAYAKTRALIGEKPFFCLSLPILITKIRNYYRQPPDESALVQVVRKLKQIVPQAVLMTKEPTGMFLEQVARDTGSIFFGPGHNYHDLVAVMRDAEFLLSGRYHHVILSSIVGCPIIPLASSSHKIHGLCELLEGAIGEPFDPTDLRRELAPILARVENITSRRAEYSLQVKEIAGKLRHRSAELGKMLCKP